MMAVLILLINIEHILNGQAYISTIKIKLLKFIKLKKLTKTAVIFLAQSTKLIRQDCLLIQVIKW